MHPADVARTVLHNAAIGRKMNMCCCACPCRRFQGCTQHTCTGRRIQAHTLQQLYPSQQHQRCEFSAPLAPHLME
jgi:hypothetical protein